MHSGEVKIVDLVKKKKIPTNKRKNQNENERVGAKFKSAWDFQIDICDIAFKSVRLK